eukprot:SAG11_NODE_2872_length_2881_cov_1.807692_2_plen_61_part_00
MCLCVRLRVCERSKLNRCVHTKKTSTKSRDLFEVEVPPTPPYAQRDLRKQNEIQNEKGLS